MVVGPGESQKMPIFSTRASERTAAQGTKLRRAYSWLRGVLEMKKALLFIAGLALLTSPAFGQGSLRRADSADHVNAPYNPTVNPADFTHVITNKYLMLKPGTKATYEKTSPEGVKRVEMKVTGKTARVMGVTTLVVLNREWLNDQLMEETKDWVAQDKDGNVWHFGEAVRDYQAGTLEEGSWKAGVDGAKPGILMLNDPKVGDTYRQEYRRGKAEDMGTVVAVGKRVAIPQGAFFEDCVQVRDWSRIKSGSEHKYHCVGVGLMVLEEKGAEQLKLVGLSVEPIPDLRTARTLASRREPPYFR
jgi:hypothetical protein